MRSAKCVELRVACCVLRAACCVLRVAWYVCVSSVVVLCTLQGVMNVFRCLMLMVLVWWRVVISILHCIHCACVIEYAA